MGGGGLTSPGIGVLSSYLHEARQEYMQVEGTTVNEGVKACPH